MFYSFCVAAYTNDVVLALKRSQMLICVLSADYLTDRNAVFVLESGVKVGLWDTELLKLGLKYHRWYQGSLQWSSKERLVSTTYKLNKRINHHKLNCDINRKAESAKKMIL